MAKGEFLEAGIEHYNISSHDRWGPWGTHSRKSVYWMHDAAVMVCKQRTQSTDTLYNLMVFGSNAHVGHSVLAPIYHRTKPTHGIRQASPVQIFHRVYAMPLHSPPPRIIHSPGKSPIFSSLPNSLFSPDSPMTRNRSTRTFSPSPSPSTIKITSDEAF